MSAAQAGAGKVVVHDLRGEDATGAVRACRNLLDDRSKPDLTLLLVIDDAHALLDHERAYETLLTAKRIDDMLCVAVGPPAAGRQVLRLPGTIGQGTGVIWVGDRTGVDWPMAAASAATIHTGPEDSGLHPLVGVLTIRPIFKRVCELVGHVPGGVASPGLRLVGTSADDSGFLSELAAALTRLLGPGSPDTAAPADTFDGYRSPARDLVPMDRSGRQAVMEDRCRRAAEEADQALEELASPLSMLAPGAAARAAERVVHAGRELGRHRELVERLFAEAHAPGGLTPAQRDTLREHGVLLPAPRTTGVTDGLGEAVEGYVAESLARGETLPRLRDNLRRLERDVSPKGSGSHVPRIEEACPKALADRLGNPAPPPPPEPWLPLAGLLAAGAASIAGGVTGLVAGVAVSAFWTVLVAMSVVRVPGAARHRGGIALNAAAAPAGTAIGLAAGGLLEPPVAVSAGAFVVGVAVAVIAACLSWRTRVVQWRLATGLNGAPHAAEALTTLVGVVAAEEWSRCAARLETADAITRARAAIAGVADGLGERVKALTGHPGEGPGTRRRGSGTGLSPVVGAHLTDLVRRALEPRWQVLSAGSAAGHQESARAETGRLLDVWEGHVAGHGPLDPPPFAGSERSRWPGRSDDDLAEIRAAAGHDPRDTMWQLCAAADLSLLDTGVVNPPTLRFAPWTGDAAGRGFPSDTRWVSGPYAGSMRLVPVRSGAVRREWSADGGERAGDTR